MIRHEGLRGVCWMIIIVDGYNLLKQLHVGKYIDEDTRMQLIHQLASYQKKRGHEIVLVFDGGINPWPIQEDKLGVCVVYPGINKSADDYIKVYISEFQGQDLLLVSSDRELNHWAGKHDIVSLNSMPFFEIVRDTLAGKDQRAQWKSGMVKTAKNDDPFLDALMEDSTKHMTIKDEDRPRIPGYKPGKEVSKIERMLQKKLEKL